MSPRRRSAGKQATPGMDRLMIRHGFVLILLALLGGVIAPFMVNPRLGVGAHTLGVLGGLVLIAIGATRPVMVLAPRLAFAMNASWFIAAYANWANTMVAGITGASHLTPIAGAGTKGDYVSEWIVFVVYVVVGVTSVVGTAIAVYGLLGRGRDASVRSR
jgi:hydroxylaminobenzene mutase